MSLTRRRSDRPEPARRRLRSSLEALEARQLLSGTSVNYYTPQQSGVIVGSLSPNLPAPTIGNLAQLSSNALAALGNEGKSVSGQDRLGNQWVITVHGPGKVIVTDATPNDGVLDDDINTIQLVGTSPTKTIVTGGVSSSSETIATIQVPGTATTDTVSTQSSTPDRGIVLFNKLISQNGVASIVLNGFVLTQTVPPPNGGLANSNTGVYLPGGVRNLEFTGVRAAIDVSQQDQPINIIIGDPSRPLKFKPNVRIDEITNTVFDSTATTIPTAPPTTPTVNIIVNGELNGLNIVSSTQQTIPAARQYASPIVGTTGRTSIQAKGINKLNVTGSAINVTAAQTATPFTSGSGLTHITTATFGGNTDGLALDVNGNIKGLRFSKGLGSPVNNSTLPANYGIPDSQTGYPANGLIGGLVSANNIGHVNVGPADTTLIQSNTPSQQQSSPGEPIYNPVPGNALNSAAITTKKNIGSVKVLGNSTRSEIKTGYDVTASSAGFDATRGASKIKRVLIKGALINSVISASYTPASTGYGQPGSSAGPGSITGSFQGTGYNTGSLTILGNSGVGFYAKHKKGYLPAN